MAAQSREENKGEGLIKERGGESIKRKRKELTSIEIMVSRRVVGIKTKGGVSLKGRRINLRGELI